MIDIESGAILAMPAWRAALLLREISFVQSSDSGQIRRYSGVHQRAVPFCRIEAWRSHHPQSRGGNRGDIDGLEFDSEIVCITVRGILVKRSGGLDRLFGDYFTSLEGIEQAFANSMMDRNVKGIVLEFDSMGGSVGGMLDVADLIYGNRGIKPVIAVVNDCACSAAYCIASAADLVLVTRTGQVGSISCVAVHVDQSRADLRMGLKYTFIAAGAKKAEGNSHEPLPASVRSEMQAEVDRVANLFIATVARNRGVPAQSIQNLQGGVCYGSGAIPLLADEEGTLDDAITAAATLSRRNTR